jgi:hypothetical protein
MGLDITAYSKLSYIGHHDFELDKNEGEPGPWCYYDDHVQAMAYDSFPQSFRGIPILGTRESGGSTFLDGGCYQRTDGTQTHAFRAGSYTGYGIWRDHLREQFNPETDPAGPFYELIWFADNEGAIGELAAVDLLADFRTNAATYHAPEPWYRAKYDDWTRAFELAADGGLVDFH